MAIQNMLGGATSPMDFTLGGTTGLPGTFVSQDIGSDVTGDGTMAKPFASFGAAITALGTPSTNQTIKCLDGANYIENIVLSSTNIDIVAPYASLSPASGNAFFLTVNTSVILQFNVISGPVVVQTNGTVLLDAQEMYGNLICNAGGIFINAKIFGAGGMDGGTGIIAGVVGYVLPSFGPYVGNVQVMTGYGPLLPLMSMGQPGVTGWYVMPTADGTNTQTITTDGAHVTSFA